MTSIRILLGRQSCCIPVGEEARLVEGLQAHEAVAHRAVLAALPVAAPLGLDEEGAVFGAQELAPLRPAADALLQHEDLARQRLLAQLLQLHVLRVLQEHLFVGGEASLLVFVFVMKVQSNPELIAIQLNPKSVREWLYF
jgi:hypothetical protein